MALAGIGAPAGPTAERWFKDEVCQYNFSWTSSQVATNWKMTGHFTQVVWKGTGFIGCAVVGPQDCPSGIASPGKTWMGVEMMVCEYDGPQSSKLYRSNVLPPIVPPVCK